MKSYPAFAMAQYVDGSVAPKSVPPETLPPCCSLSFAGFHTFDPAGASNAGPYFHVAGSNAPLLTASAGAVVLAPLSRPAVAASGNLDAPAFGLLAYGSAVGAGLGGGCCG